MNKRAFGIGMILAVLAVLAVSATPTYAHVDVYFSPDPSTISLAPGESVSIQLLADVDANETYGLRSLQIGIDFDDDVVNITNVENPCSFAVGETCYVRWWTPFSGLNLRSWGDSHFQWTTGSSASPGYASPLIAPIANITIEGIGPGTSPLVFTHEIRQEPSIGLSGLFDGENDEINPVANITWVDTSITCSAPEETFNKPLVAGWNLISLPLTSSNNSASKVLENVSYDAVYRYSATAPRGFESVATMDPGVGYFVNVTASEQTWTYNGTPYTSMNVSIEPGLNMVSWLNCSMSVSDALSSLDGKYNYVAMFNATSKKFEAYNPHAPSVFNDFTTMDRGTGYFISARADCPRLVKDCPL